MAGTTGNGLAKPGPGGRREGAGRPRGSKNKRSIATIEAAAAADLELPLPRLLRRMNDKSLPEMYRDSLATAAAPYCHSRLSSAAVETKAIGPDDMTDEQLAAFAEKVEAALRRPGPHLRRVK
jgi:hypothetical protein